jgi:hypothetical protein
MPYESYTLVSASNREVIFPTTLKDLWLNEFMKGMKDDANSYHPITFV